ncbi:TetR family transcriptional regulator [Bacillus sp. 31A1R]|uniref:TetR family transcriptional regulator n=1 Tax=Robertmurraya mangrovi TaxID=3098077 RepID=A0ABU5IYG5_9BACI|nr:TetR family transcriptional regulator [Bacillus sp. 31A1R]MDZ5472187.1 TetR family transcriptional regulator [Bacillus sp. 31A1R]
MTFREDGVSMPVVSEKHREERKNIILKAAKEVFIKKGFTATTMQDIIETSHISRGGVYTYFQNTEDIFVELLRRRDIEDVWGPQDLYKNGLTSWQVLMSIIDTVSDTIEYQKDQLVPALYQYYFTVAWESKKHIPSLEARIEQVKNSLAYIIQRGIEDQEFKCDIPPEDIARTIITFCDGIYISSFHLGPERVALKNQFLTFKSYLRTCLFNNQSS